MTKAGEPENFYQAFVVTWQSDDCLTWPYARISTGYGQMSKPEGGRVLVHRRLCEEVNEPPPTEHHDAAHSCGKGHEGCCNPKHLHWATRAQNRADAIKHGTQGRGGAGNKTILSRAQVEEIRRRLKDKEPQRSIAKHFGVSQATISKINTGDSW